MMKNIIEIETCIDANIFENQQQIDNFICLFGMGVLNNPVSDQCGHMYCKACIQTWLKKNDKCPTSRKLLNLENLRPVLPVKDFLDNLTVECQNCKEKMNLQRWKSHIINCEIGQIEPNMIMYSNKKELLPFINKILQLKQQVQKHEKQSSRFTGKENLNLFQMQISNKQTQDFIIKKKIKFGFPFEINLLDFQNLFSDFLNINLVHKNRTLQNMQKTTYGFIIFTELREIKIYFIKSLLSVELNISVLEDGTEIDFPQKQQLPGKIKDAIMFIKSCEDGLELTFKTFPTMNQTFFIDIDKIEDSYIYLEKITLEEYQLIFYIYERSSVFLLKMQFGTFYNIQCDQIIFEIIRRK